MEKLHKLFFDPALHKYTDEYGNVYTSMTTCIKQYTEDFKKLDIARACERIGKGQTSLGTHHPKYEKYKGKSAKQLMYEWDKKAEEACIKGNNRHNYLEDIINNANKYISSSKRYSGTRIYTIEDITKDHDFGRIDLDYFVASGLKERYPTIFDIILSLHNKGYSFYAELAVFDNARLISGLVDLPAINHDTKEFIVLDWKTNRDEITDIPGYFEKDKDGKTTDNFINTGEYFSPPIDHVPASIKHKYSMQVSGYASLIESFGFKNKGNIICHIRENENEQEYVTFIKAIDLRAEAQIMFTDFHYNNNIKTQKKIFNGY